MTSSPRIPNSRKIQRRQLNDRIAKAAAALVELVREHIDTNGRVSFDLVDHIMVGRRVGVVFVDDSQSGHYRMEATMSAAQRRLERLIREDEERGVGSIQDAAFFERHPDRSFRMRLATPGETTANEVISNNGKPLALPKDALWWTIVKQVAPGMRMRMQVYAPLPPGPLDEIPEDVAQGVFNFAAERE